MKLHKIAGESGRIVRGENFDGHRLAARGRIFNPLETFRTDDERVLAVAKNPALLNDLEAELALVFYDAEARQWSLTRDAFGQTPLFYAFTADGLAWAFSLPALFDELGYTPPADEKTIFDYLATHYRHIFRDPGRTFHEGVFQVPAGSTLIYEDGRALLENWLDLFSAPPEAATLNAEDASRRYMEILRENVAMRVKALPKAGFTVSSGLDSGAVASLGSELISAPLVYSVGYRGGDVGDYDESAGIDLIAEGRDWRRRHLMLTGPNLVAEVGDLIGRVGAPLITVTWLAYYRLAQAARADGLDCLFTGLGGDESLAGEFEHFFYFFADLKAAGDEARLANEVAAWARLHDHPVFKKSPAVLEAHWRDCVDFKTGRIKVNESRFRANWEYFDEGWIEANRGDAPMPMPFKSFLSSRLYQEIRLETTPPTLWAEAASSRAAGVFASYPFLSPRLFRLALNLPSAYKYQDGLTKMLLRRELGGILPEKVRWNPVKTGFNAPLHHWAKEQSAELFDCISSGPLAAGGRLKRGALERIFDEHRRGEKNHMMLLWPLLNASLFL